MSSADSPREADAYEKNTKKQYEALGRFVEAFEMMVHVARVSCIDMLAIGLTRRRKDLIAVPLYHQAFSAKPLFETFRSVFMEIISDDKFQKRHNLTEGDVKKFSGVLAAISGDYMDLANHRNNLLHGTWFVGYKSVHDPHSETFHVSKFTTSGSGLKRLPLPSTAPELDALRNRCEETRTWIEVVHGCLPPARASLSFAQCFRVHGKIWERIWPSPNRFPVRDS
jgi:hypothetical protein